MSREGGRVDGLRGIYSPFHLRHILANSAWYPPACGTMKFSSYVLPRMSVFLFAEVVRARLSHLVRAAARWTVNPRCGGVLRISVGFAGVLGFKLKTLRLVPQVVARWEGLLAGWNVPSPRTMAEIDARRFQV